MKDLIDGFNNIEKWEDTVKECLENNISLMPILIDALTPGYFKNEVVLSLLIENEKKNDWIFPYILKLLYNDPTYLNNILGYVLYELIHKILANNYDNHITCDQLLVNFIIDSNNLASIRSIGFDCLSVLHVNDIISTSKLEELMTIIYKNLPEDSITDFAITACDNGLFYDLLDKLFMDKKIDEMIYPYEAYQKEKKISFTDKKKMFKTKEFFNININLLDYGKKHLKF